MKIMMFSFVLSFLVTLETLEMKNSSLLVNTNEKKLENALSKPLVNLLVYLKLKEQNRYVDFNHTKINKKEIESVKVATNEIVKPTNSVELASMNPAPMPTLVSSTPVNLLGSTADWFPILNGNNFDPFDDTQASRTDVDLVGDINNPLIYLHYYDGTTPGSANDGDDVISIRWRLGAEGTGGGAPPRITIFTLVGMDVDYDGVLDGFIIFDGGAGTKRSEVVNTGPGANDGPSTSSFDYTRNSPTAYTSYAPDWSVVFASAATYAETTNYDLDADGDTDVFVSMSMPWVHIKNFMSTVKGKNITIDTQVRFIALTASQSNSINGDFGGVNDKTGDLTQTWSQLLAYSVPMSFSEPFSTILDSDNDGVADYLDIDDDNDGILDTTEGEDDDDGDGIINRLDTDSDGDGILDNIEGQGNTFVAATGVDTDGDGLDNAYDPDNGGTSVAVPNTDGTGKADFLDIDADGDGIRDSVELTADFDGDGIPAYRDTDSDGDSILDNIEAQTTAAFVAASGTDTDGDGLDNAYDPDNGGAYITLADTDSDTHYDYLDIDSDNDGIRDSIELNIDQDGDSAPNFRDLDSDSDGIPDNTEGQGNTLVAASGNDTDNDGLDNAYDPDNGGAFLAPPNTDSDALSDYLDIDSDGDGLLDSVELLTDFDADSIPEFRDTDSDGDGITDNVEAQSTALFAAPSGNDTDNDGLDDTYDTDNSGTAITRVDTDGDGKFDYKDLDSDNDGIQDSIELTADTDSDSIPNFRDLDSDGDGIPDLIEAQTTAAFTILSGNDTDNDGLDNTFDADNGGTLLTPTDTDTDTIPDYLDTDSDNDLLTDTAESGLTALSSTDADNDGLDDAIDTNDSVFGPSNAGITNILNDLADNINGGDVDFRSGGYTLSGSIYNDANHSFTMENDETGTSNTIYVKLIKAGVVEKTTLANNSTGYYEFTNVIGGVYNLIIDTNNSTGDIIANPPATWIATERQLFTIESLNVNNYGLNALNFGLYRGSTVSLNLLIDNGIGSGIAFNAIKDGTELPLNNVTVRLRNSANTIIIDENSSSLDGEVRLWIPHTYNNQTVRLQSDILDGYLLVSNLIGTQAGTITTATAEFNFTMVSGNNYTGSALGFVLKSTFVASMEKIATPGSEIQFSHTFRANAPGSISLSATQVNSPVLQGWSYQFFNDTNKNLSIDIGESQITTPIVVTANQEIFIIAKMVVPSNAPIGGSSLTEITLTHTYTGSIPLVISNLMLTDLVSINEDGSAGLELVKSADKQTASPGETITYTILYKNLSTSAINSMVINDATPTFTTFSSAAYGTLPNNLTNCVITAPTVGNSGLIKWTFTGTLQSGAEGNVTFQVVIDN